MVKTSVKTRLYPHPEQGKDEFFGIAGRFIPQQETVLEYKGRKVLYAIGQVRMESSCCNLGDSVLTVVPGYIVGWKNKVSDDGLTASEVEPVQDEKAKEEITKIIQAREPDIFAIQFWEAG